MSASLDYAALLDSVLACLEDHGVSTARVRFEGFELDVTLSEPTSGAPIPPSSAERKPEDADDEDEALDMRDVDPRFALERLNFATGDKR